MNQVTPDVSEGDGDSGDTRRVREMVIQVTPDVSEGDGDSGDTRRVSFSHLLAGFLNYFFDNPYPI